MVTDINLIISIIIVLGLFSFFYWLYIKKVKKELYYKIYKAIEKFKPSINYKTEEGYQGELIGWLKIEFPDIKGELQTGSSRPDIIIKDIAIEIKGPTDTRALDTLATKCLRYSRYYKHLIIVLFRSSFSERYYNEVMEGIKEHFPNVRVIRKE